MRTAVLTISTSVSRRETDDISGPRLAVLAEAAGCDVDAMEVVPDDYALIEDRLHHYVDAGFALILTTGGIGLAAGEVTPEATLAVLQRDTPGIAERLRRSPAATLTRGVAGIAARTLIVNLPGDPVALDEAFSLVAAVLPEAVDTVRRDGERHAGR